MQTVAGVGAVASADTAALIVIAANVLVFLWERQAQNVRVERYAFYPCAVSGPCTRAARDHLPWAEGALSSLFLHASWWHLGGNMLFLFIFGNNVEDSMGRMRYLVFYLLCGIAAALTQTFLSPHSGIPMVGASGAIGGVMGAYVVLYPRVQIHMLVFLFVIVTRIVVPAYWMLGYWFLLQLVSGWGSIGADRGGVAFWAHVGGFIAGAVLVFVFRDKDLVAEHRAQLHNFVRGHFRDSPV